MYINNKIVFSIFKLGPKCKSKTYVLKKYIIRNYIIGIPMHALLHIRYKIYLLISNICVILLLASAHQLNWITVDADSLLGMTSYLPPIFWLGLTSITLLSVKAFLDEKLKNNLIFVVILFVLGLYLFGIATLCEENARMPWSYYPYGEVKTLFESHHINLIEKYPAISYRFWPSFHFISAIVLYITDINIAHLTKYMPLFWVNCFILISFTIARKFDLDPNKSFLLVFLGLSSFWVSQYYYSPQSIAFLLYLVLFLIITTYEDRITKKLLFLIIFVSLIFTHILTPIPIIAGLLIFSISKKHKNLFLIVVALFVSYYLYFVPFIFDYGVNKLAEQIDTYGSFAAFSTNKFSPDTFSRYLINIFRLSYLVILSAISIITIYFNKKYIIKNYSFLWLIGISLIFPIGYGMESFERLYIFSLIPALALVVSLNDCKKVFVLLMVIFVILHMPAHYGDECHILTRTTELIGANFSASHVISDKPYFYQMYSYIHFDDPESIVIPYRTFGSFVEPDVAQLNKLSVIINTEQTKNRMIYMFGRDYLQDWLNQKNQFLNIVYNSKEFIIYLNDTNLATKNNNFNKDFYQYVSQRSK